MTKYKIILIAFGFVSCTNISQYGSLSTVNNPATLSNGNTTSFTHIMKNVTEGPLSGTIAAGAPSLELDLSVDSTVAGFLPLTQFCSSTDSTKGCMCELDWTDINSVTGTNISYSRTKRFPISEAQTALVKCQMLQSDWDQIATGITVTVNIIATPNSNSTGLLVQSIPYKKGTSISSTGDFMDSTLTPFRNVHRYSCYSKSLAQVPYEILNQLNAATNPAGGTTTIAISSAFCTASGGTNCNVTPRSGYSAQSYYRNLYVRSDFLGQINTPTSSYECPQVFESIHYSSVTATPTSEQRKFWPLDTTFALATTYSTDWSVGVRAASVLYIPGDSSSDPTLWTAGSEEGSCHAGSVTGNILSENGITIKCMGYAKLPQSNGTCGSLTDSNGRTRPLTRLRRYRAMYPAYFGADGKVSSAKTAFGPYNEADEVYVPDRLVVNSSGVPTGSMIYGPKPCNFSWFDHEGVTNRVAAGTVGAVDFGSHLNVTTSGSVTSYAVPTYRSTSNYQYQKFAGYNVSVNPDGRILPNIDLAGGSVNSCGATLPYVDRDQTLGQILDVRLLTSTQMRTDFVTLGGAATDAGSLPALGTKRVYLDEIPIRPIDAWTPNYIEDTTFQACVPASDPYVEPPMEVFKQDSDHYGWCTKAYPTQNPYWASVNAKKVFTGTTNAGMVVNYTGAYPVAPPSTPGSTALVKWFTSHQVGVGTSTVLDSLNNQCIISTANSVSQICTNTTADVTGCTIFLTNLAPAGSAHTNTCDRTVVPSSTTYTTFPLLAADPDIDSMLRNEMAHDQTFSCEYSVNADATKVGKKVPSSACCGVSNGTPILQPLMSGAGGVGAHMEPYSNPATPTIRFCGNPVE